MVIVLKYGARCEYIKYICPLLKSVTAHENSRADNSGRKSIKYNLQWIYIAQSNNKSVNNFICSVKCVLNLSFFLQHMK